MIKLTNKKKIVILLVILLMLGFRYGFFIGPLFKVTNKTGHGIYIFTIQLQAFQVEPTLEEMEGGLDYKVDDNDSVYIKLYPENWFKDNVSLGAGFEYRDTELNKTPLKGMHFSDVLIGKEKQAYCGFKVEIYPNKKTVVTPTRKWGCLHPMYYYDNEIEKIP